jgi:hypothetical protein
MKKTVVAPVEYALNAIKNRAFFVVSGVILACLAVGAQAQPAKYAQECGTCHTPYPAGMLPAASWERLMGGLNKHFGTDASLDEVTNREISAWLKSGAGTFRRVREEPPQDRITKSNWFVRQHDEVSSSTWKRASVGSASNCSACHAGASKGNYNEHEVRIPK